MLLVLQFFITGALFQLINASGFCNIEKKPLSVVEGKWSLPNTPFVYVGRPDRQKAAASSATRGFILENHGDEIVQLSSSNTYSHGKLTATLEEYITTSVDSNAHLANETYYLFGSNYDGIWQTLTELYNNVPCKFCDTAGAKTLGLGGENSGVAFHLHGPGFSEPILGAKRWFLFSPEVTHIVNKFNPNLTMSMWVDTLYNDIQAQGIAVQDYEVDTSGQNVPLSTLSTDAPSSLENSGGGFSSSPTSSLHPLPSLNTQELQLLKQHLFECTLFPGDVLYFPAMWMHGTLNVESYNVFMSLFLDPQLIK
jgi:hypothetical protein